MTEILSLVSRIREIGNRYIINELSKNNAGELCVSHGDILVALYLYKKLTMKDIAKIINRTKPTVTVLIDKLEKLDFVEKQPSINDNRVVYIVLTKKGEEFKHMFEKISNGLDDLLTKNLNLEEVGILEGLLKRVLAE